MHIVIDPEALELTNYVTQLSAFQQALTELRKVTPDPASESNNPLFLPGTEVQIKTLGSGGQSLKPLWEGSYQVILLLPQLSKCQELICAYTTLELRDGTLRRTK